MSKQQMTHTQAVALAKFVHTLRGDWDVPGIEHALGVARTRAGAGDLAVAAITAAASHSNRTPAVIALDGPHWRKLPGGGPRPEAVGPERTCSICTQTYEACRFTWADDHEFLSVVEQARRAVKPEQGFFAEIRDRMATLGADAKKERIRVAEEKPKVKTLPERVAELDEQTQMALEHNEPGRAEFYAERASALSARMGPTEESES